MLESSVKRNPWPQLDVPGMPAGYNRNLMTFLCAAYFPSIRSIRRASSGSNLVRKLHKQENEGMLQPYTTIDVII